MRAARSSDDAGRGFAEAGFDESGWAAVAVHEPVVVPEARVSPFVRRLDEFAVTEVITTPSGRTVVDFGQNLVGRLRIRVAGPAGTEITLRHAEVLEHGELGTRPLRHAAATDVLTLAGSEIEWEPEFTFHGFRYAEISGWPGEFDPVGRDGRGDPQRHGAHRLVRDIPPAREQASRERRLGSPRELPLRADRLPAARRAARVDRRYPGVRADRELPLRRARVPRLVAARPRARAGARERHRAVRGSERARTGASCRCVGRCRHRRALGASTSATPIPPCSGGSIRA